MISLAIFTSLNSLNTFIATIESFFENCEDIHLISEIIHIDDRSPLKHREYYLNIIKNIFKGKNVIQIYKNHESIANHAEICESFRKYIIQSSNKYVFILEDDWFFIRKFNLNNFNKILNSNNCCQLVLSNAINLLKTQNQSNLKEYNDTNFFINDDRRSVTISERYDKNDYFWHEVFDYQYFSLNPCLTKINFFRTNGNFEFTKTFELDYNLKVSKNLFNYNLLSGDPYVVHIGKYKKIWQDIL